MGARVSMSAKSTSTTTAPDIDEQLHEGHQLGAQDQVATGQGAEGDDEPERGVHELVGGDRENRARCRDQSNSTEEDVQACHTLPVGAVRAGLFAAAIS